MDKIDIILLTFQHSELTEKCIRSIKENTKIGYRIIWVDNGSFQFHYMHTLQLLTDLEIDFLPIRLRENRGFAGGINEGMRSVESEYFVIMNNDVEVTPFWLEPMLDPMIEYKNVGVVGPVTNNIGSVQKKEKEVSGKFYPVKSNISYFCTAFRKELIEKVWLLDENFFNGGEDDDYNDRVRNAGYLVGFTTKSFVYHHHRATRHDPALFPLWKENDRRNREYLKKKREGRSNRE